MRRFRRVVQTLVAIWSAGMFVKVVGWIVPMADGIQAALLLAAMAIGGIVGWRATREVEPFTPDDIRNGSIGYGIVAMLIVPLTAGAIAATAGNAFIAPAAIAAALLVVGATIAVHRRADQLGVEDPDSQPTNEFPKVDERSLTR